MSVKSDKNINIVDEKVDKAEEKNSESKEAELNTEPANSGAAEKKKISENKKSNDKSQASSRTNKKSKSETLRGRRRLYADYQYDNVKNKKGKTVKRKVYKGKYYCFIIPKEYKRVPELYIRKIKLTHLGFYIACLILWAISSFIPSQAMGHIAGKADVVNASTLVPYVVCALPLMYLLITVGELILFTRENKHEQAFMEALTKNMRGWIIVLLISAIITFIGQAVFMIVNYKAIQSAAAEATVLALMAALAGTCFFWLKRHEQFKMKEF